MADSAFTRPEPADVTGTAFEPVTRQHQMQNWNRLNAAEDAWRTADGSPWRQSEPGPVGAFIGKVLGSEPAQSALNMAMFLGPGAKTANLPALTKAQGMAKAGTPREAIWSETGWFQGPDKKWRFEIDDSGVPVTRRLDEGALASNPAMKDAIPHKELFAAYPEMANVRLAAEREATGGSWNAHNNTINIRPIDEGNFTPEASRQAKRVGLHEAQHAVQDKEGFAPGANPLQFHPRIAEARYMTDLLSAKTERMQNAHGDEASLYLSRAARGDKDALRFVNDAQSKWYEKLGKATDDNPFGLTPQQAVAAEIGEGDSVFQRAIAQYNKEFKVGRMDPQDIYRRHAGEVEARTVQKRMDMTPEQRKARAPWLDYDIPEAQQIIKFGE